MNDIAILIGRIALHAKWPAIKVLTGWNFTFFVILASIVIIAYTAMAGL